MTGLWRSDPIGLVAVTLPGALMIALQKSVAIRRASDDTIKVWDYFATKVLLVLSSSPAWGDCPPFVRSPKIGILPVELVDKQLRLARLALARSLEPREKTRALQRLGRHNHPWAPILHTLASRSEIRSPLLHAISSCHGPTRQGARRFETLHWRVC